MSSPANYGLRGADTKFHMGVPSWYREGWQRFQFDVHNFKDLPATKNRALGPPIPFQYLGRKYQLEIFPNGKVGVPSTVEGRRCVVVCLCHVSGPAIDVMTKLVFKATSRGFESASSHPYPTEKDFFHFRLPPYHSIAENSRDFLRNGTFTLSLYLKRSGSQDKPSLPFVPHNPCNQSMLRMFDDEKHADILFDVKEADGDEPTKIYCHRFILQTCAPDLGDMCEEYTDLTPVPINGIKPEIFRAMLRYLYGGEVPEEIMSDHSRDIIDAADRYGVAALKVEAEAQCVLSTDITIENVVDNFYFADTKKCALLKEKVLDFLIQNGQEVLSEIKDAPESETMFTDFLTAVTLGKSCDGESNEDDPTKFKIMPVDTLRRKLCERGLDCYDGTREIMVTALEESYAAESERKRKRDDNASDDGHVEEQGE